MKKVMLIGLILIGMISCDDSVPSSQAKVLQTKKIAQGSEWRVTYFLDSDQDETSNFNEFTFAFGTNGEVTATNGISSYTGSWSITSDGSSEDIDFNITFLTPPNFEELTEDWQIISINDTRIELTHVSGGNGGTDFLTFEKV
jgi:hypothetical protein